MVQVNRPVLMAIIGPGGGLSAGQAIRGGADLVQVRAKGLSSRSLMALVREVIAEVGDARRVIVNSRPDIAERAGACGVHLPESGLDPKAVRRDFPELSVSVSRHDLAGLVRASDEGADFAMLGPVYETPGKGDHAIGVEGWREMVRGLGLPVIAVGGIVPRNCRAIIDAGARGVAAIRPFSNLETAQSVAEAFRSALSDPERGSNPF